jgi:hypothetical protein
MWFVSHRLQTFEVDFDPSVYCCGSSVLHALAWANNTVMSVCVCVSHFSYKLGKPHNLEVVVRTLCGSTMNQGLCLNTLLQPWEMRPWLAHENDHVIYQDKIVALILQLHLLFLSSKSDISSQIIRVVLIKEGNCWRHSPCNGVITLQKSVYSKEYTFKVPLFLVPRRVEWSPVRLLHKELKKRLNELSWNWIVCRFTNNCRHFQIFVKFRWL